MRHRILVTDAEQRAALALVRSLGRAGHEIHVCAARSRSLAGASRYAVRQAVVRSPLESSDEFLEEVVRLARQWRIDTVIPVTEAALLATLRAAERLEPALVPFPELESFRRISDKGLVLATAQRLGIGVPRQEILPRPDALAELPPDALAFPVVVKPVRSVIPAGRGAIKLGVSYAADPEELRRRVSSYPAAAYPLLLQQRVIGPGLGIFLLIWEGQQLALFAHRRLREKPPSGGVSVYRESIAPPPHLVAGSRALLETLGWQGVAMIEYKVEAATGAPYLMEINGRFWGSLQLAIDAGVDFPALLVAAAHGEAPEPVTRYRLGVRSRWWWGDVDHLIARLRCRDDGSDRPAEGGSRMRALVEFFKLWRPGDRNEIFRWSDPMPFVVETLDWLALR